MWSLFACDVYPERVYFFDDVADDVELVVVHAWFADDDDRIAEGCCCRVVKGADNHAACAVVDNEFACADEDAVDSDALDELPVWRAYGAGRVICLYKRA